MTLTEHNKLGPIQAAANDTWRRCIFSGINFKIKIIEFEGNKYQRLYGFCQKEESDIDILRKCPVCKNRKTERDKPNRKLSEIQKKRISKARQRHKKRKEEKLSLDKIQQGINDF